MDFCIYISVSGALMPSFERFLGGVTVLVVIDCL